MRKQPRLPNNDEQAVLEEVQVRLLDPKELTRFNRSLDKHHYLKAIRRSVSVSTMWPQKPKVNGWLYWFSVQPHSTSNTGTAGSAGHHNNASGAYVLLGSHLNF